MAGPALSPEKLNLVLYVTGARPGAAVHRKTLGVDFGAGHEHNDPNYKSCVSRI
jgi:hypothetical protein